jgi:hypothetical protein
MSGTTLDYTAPAGMGGDDTGDQATQAAVVAAQTVDETAQAITTHEGVVTAAFVFSYNGATIPYALFQQIIADVPLYTALNASSVAAASITWNN